jgi:hypothetical protein
MGAGSEYGQTDTVTVRVADVERVGRAVHSRPNLAAVGGAPYVGEPEDPGVEGRRTEAVGHAKCYVVDSHGGRSDEVNISP